MALRAPTEREIDDAVEGLKRSPGTFQRLIEAVVRHEFPDRGSRLISIGRLTSDVPIKGWPDAETRLPDGRFHAFEVTHSPDWKKHVREDVEKLKRSSGNAESYLLAAWAKTPPRADEATYRKLVVSTGVQPENVRFIFRQELVSMLTAPRYARIWAEYLELPVISEPFALITDIHTLYGTEKHRDSFMPTRKEFIDGFVHRASLADTVESELRDRGWSFLCGRGAAGKTVMATSIALGAAYRDQTVYYVDLAEIQDSEESWRALEILSTRGEQGVLFIVDNIHRDRVTGRKLFDYWKSAGNGSRLLLVGRLTSFVSARGEGDSLAELSDLALVLEPHEEDFGGVYLRLAGRMALGRRIPAPPPDVLRDWKHLFGGDLLAFSAAVTSRIQALMRGEWGLAPRDAALYLAETYLDGRPAEEIEVLRRLSALALLEIHAEPKALRHRVPRRALDQGLVLRSEHGLDRRLRFRLVHPGMGDLFLGVLPDAMPLQILLDVARDEPLTGVLIAARLRFAGRIEEAREVAETFGSPGSEYSPAFSAWLLPTTVRLLVNLGLITEGDIARRIAGFTDQLAADTLITRRGYLVRFLEFAKKYAPDAVAGFGALLEDTSTRHRFLLSLAESLPGEVVRFLEWMGRELPGVQKNILADLALPDIVDSLCACLLSSQLGELLNFVEYLGDRDVAATASITESLVSPDRLAAAAHLAGRTPPVMVAEYIRWLRLTREEGLPLFAASLLEQGGVKLLMSRRDGISHFLLVAQGLPEVYEACIAELGQLGDEQLARFIGARSSHQSAALLDFLRTNEPSLFASTIRGITAPHAQEQLVQSALAGTARDAKERIDFIRSIDSASAARFEEVLLCDANVDAFCAMIVRSSRADAAPFLRSVAAVHRTRTAAIATGLRVAGLVQDIAASPGNHVAELLLVLADMFPELHMECMRALCAPAAFAAIVKSIAEGAHGVGTSLLRFAAAARDRELGARLVAALAAADTLPQLVSSLSRAGFGGIASFMELLVDCASPDHLPTLDVAFADALPQLLLGDVWHQSPDGVVRILAVAPRFGPRLEALAHDLRDDAGFNRAFVIAAMRTPATYLHLTNLTRDADPALHEALNNRLKQPKTTAIFVSSESDLALNEIVALLHLIEDAGVQAILSEALSDEFIAKLARAPLEQVTTLFRIVSAQMPTTFEVIRTLLSKDEAMLDFVRTARSSPAEHLVTFLRFASTGLPAVFQAIVSSLDAPGACSIIISKASRSTLEHLTSFLAFAAEHLPHACEDIAELITEPRKVAAWAECAASGEQSAFATFLKFLSRQAPEHAFARFDVLERVIAALDGERWIAFHRTDGYLFPVIARELGRCGRVEIVRPIAVTALLGPNLTVWRHGIQLHAFAAAVRSAGASSPELVDGFFQIVATQGWLSAQYAIATSGLLAGALFDLWCHLTPQQLQKLLIPALYKRFSEVWRMGRHDSGAALVERINLTGTMSLLSQDGLPFLRISDAILNDAARLMTNGTAGKYQLQFWSAVRYLGTVRGRRPSLDPAILSEALQQLSDHTPGEYPPINRLFAELADWLRGELSNA